MDIDTLNNILENDSDRKLIINNLDIFNKNYELFKFAKDLTTGLFITASTSKNFFNLQCPNPKCNKKVITCIRLNTDDIPTTHLKHSRGKNTDPLNECENYMPKPKDKDLENDKIKIKKKLDEIHYKAREITFNNLLAGKTIDINKICDYDYDVCDTKQTYIIKKEEGDTVKKEYSFNWEDNDYRADIAILDKDNNLKYIIEIAHTHKTEEHKRPDNIFWCEISAICVMKHDIKQNIIISRTDYNKDLEPERIIFNCLRKHYCVSCMEENIRLKKIEDDEAIAKMKEEAIMKELKEAKEAEEARIALQSAKELKIFEERKLICTHCNNKIVNRGFKRVYIKFENDFFLKYLKSNIIICKKCYEKDYTLYSTFRETPYSLNNPELYLNEYKRIKKNYKNEMLKNDIRI